MSGIDYKNNFIVAGFTGGIRGISRYTVTEPFKIEYDAPSIALYVDDPVTNIRIPVVWTHNDLVGRETEEDLIEFTHILIRNTMDAMYFLIKERQNVQSNEDDNVEFD
jgi:hypothetical protein